MWPTDLPWQIQVLIADALITVPITSVIMARGIQYNRVNGSIFLLWNIAILALIGTGGSFTWQHIVYATMQLWATASSLHRVVKRKHYPPSEKAGGVAFFATVLTVGVIYLLIGGSA